MRVAVFSDVHANIIALERFVAATRSAVDGYLCLGDVVDYGPWNDECLQMVLSLPGITFIEGNHECLFREAGPPDHELPLVKAFYRHSRQFFSRADLIAELPRQTTLGTYECVHTIEGRSIYPNTAVEIARNYMIGHSHHQFHISRSGFSIVNPGSVGQNRKWIDMLDYLIFDTSSGEIQMHALSYDIDLFISELRARRYPEECIGYYMARPRNAA